MTDREDKICPVCEEYMLEGDLVEEITSIRLGEEDYDDVITEHISIHASCFMNIVNIDKVIIEDEDMPEGAVSRSKIMAGAVKSKEEDGEYWLEIKE